MRMPPYHEFSRLRSLMPCRRAGSRYGFLHHALSVCAIILFCTYVSGFAQSLMVQHVSGAGGAHAGSSVAGSGDHDGDGFDDFVVGLPYAGGGGSSGGEVRVISGRTGAIIFSNTGTGNEHLGLSVTAGFDANGDGHPDYAAGYNELNTVMAGGVRVYDGTTGLLLYQRSASLGGLGLSMSTLDDINGNGRDELIVGKPIFALPPLLPVGAGGVEVVEYSPTTGTTSTLVSSFGAFTNGNYGTSVANAGDLDGDGVCDIAIGEPGYREFGSIVTLFPGRVRVLSGQDAANGTVTQIRSYRGSCDFGHVGEGLATGSDITGDGIPDVIVGSLTTGNTDIFSGAGGVAPLVHHFDPNNIATSFFVQPGFGRSMAFVPDLNGDGVPEFAVGSPLDGAGKVFVFDGSTRSIIETIRGRGTASRFGAAMAAGRDVDGDGFQELIVGSPLENTGLLFANTGGAVRVFSLRPSVAVVAPMPLDFALIDDLNGDGSREYVIGSGGSLCFVDGSSDTVLFNSNVTTSPSDFFGFALANFDDLDGDGQRDILATAPFADSAVGADTGAVYVVSSLFGIAIAIIDAGTYQQANGGFGHSVCVLDDLDGDGVREFAVGAPSSAASFSSPQSGIVLIHSGTNGAILNVLSGVAAGDDFGWSLASGEDLDGDGVVDLVVGAPNALGGAGEVKVFSGTTLTATNPTLLWSLAGTGNSQCGFDVANAGDVNGDGTADVVVGEPMYSSSLVVEEGRTRVVSGVTGAVINSYAGEHAYSQFGFAVSGVGDMDGDGVCDVAVASPNFQLETPVIPANLNAEGRIRIFLSSGETRAITGLTKVGGRLSYLGDHNGDGFGSLVIDGIYMGNHTVVVTPRPLGGLEVYGQGTPGCDGRLLLIADSPPRLGNSSFSVVLDNGPSSAPGGFFVADPTAKLDPGQDLLGIGLIFHVDPMAVQASQVYLVPTDVTGHAAITASIPFIPALAGIKVILQGIWYEGACQTTALGYATTNGLEVTLRLP